MSGVVISPDDPFLNDFSFDVTLDEQHTATVTKTAVPIENGSTISDHVVLNPPSFACTVLITNTPIRRTAEGEGVELPVILHIGGRPPTGIGPFAGAGVLPHAEEFNAFTMALPVDRVRRMCDRLQGLLEMRKTLTVITTRRIYRDMILISVGDPVTSENHVHSVEIALAFEPLRTVYTDSVAAPKPAKPSGQGNANVGKKDPKPESTDPYADIWDKEPDESGLRKAGKSLLKVAGVIVP